MSGLRVYKSGSHIQSLAEKGVYFRGETCFLLMARFFKLQVKIAMAQMENYQANTMSFVVIILLSFVFF